MSLGYTGRRRFDDILARRKQSLPNQNVEQTETDCFVTFGDGVIDPVSGGAVESEGAPLVGAP